MTGSQWLKPINIRRNVGIKAKSTEEDVEPLSPGAQLFLAPQFNCCIISLAGSKTKIDVEIVKEGIERTMIKHPRVSSKLVFDPKKGDKPIGWVRTKVIVDDHIIVPDLDPNMDSPDQFLEDYISNMTKTPMDLSKPLWEIHLLNIKTKNANAIGIFKIHHSMGDGTSIMSHVLACTRQTANPNALPTLPTDKNKKRVLRPSSSLGLLSLFYGMLFLFKMVWNTLIDVSLFIASTLWLKDTKTPLKGNLTTGTGPKRFVYRTVSLEDIKLVKRALDVTINDVLLGMTQAGLSYYLNRKYGEIKGDKKDQGNNLPKNIRLRSTVLVNRRSPSTIEALAERMASDVEGRWKWENAVGYVILPFNIAIRDDPLDYIRDAKATIDKKKCSLEVPCTYDIAMVLLKIFGLPVVAALSRRLLSHVTLSFSNLLGPQEEISFYGHPMVFLASTVYGHPQALTIHFQSYMDKMTFVLAIDPDVIPDPQKLCDDIEESLGLAKKAVLEKKFKRS
ncbi:wax ester synthase/diacylglycerol acyltransferase 11-like isoform X2 [Silene latifolia]|uniref:wax ester synthase/diacylglycerol acyltransferase 11-like isoform X2 n=1 Tax=Silene latifolia TaxID=37657 RepID=UPI003D77BC25